MMVNVLFLHLLWENANSMVYNLYTPLIIPTVNLFWALGPVDFPDRAGLLVSFSEFLMPYQISASLVSPMSRNHPYQLSLQLPVS